MHLTSAMTGDGLDPALQWLAQNMTNTNTSDDVMDITSQIETALSSSAI